MRIIAISLFYVFILAFGFSSYAKTIEDTLSCASENTDNLDTIVVFLNGITNTLYDAESSRALLATRLGSVCSGTNCVVQKFYNETDGFIDDVQELGYAGDLERDSANYALRQLVTDIRMGYFTYLEYLQDSTDANLEHYRENDDKVWQELLQLSDDAENSTSDPEIVFSEAGVRITDWLINHLKESTNLTSIDSSLYLISMNEKIEFYDAKFKYYYNTALSEYYLSDRKFYGSDADAVKALTRTVEGLVTYLEAHMLSGKKIVVVAHSQGNHMIELAHTVLKEKWGEVAMQAIQVVGVASVASTTPSDTYLTWDDDDVVLYTYDYTSDGNPLAPNFSVKDESPADYTNDHSFTDVYLSQTLKGRYNPRGRGNISAIQDKLANQDADSSLEYPVERWIVGLIEGSIATAIPYQDQISSTGLISASVRWEDFDDMDLWVNENDEASISYRRMIGLYGELDRDDLDGNGPEHYSTNIQCSDAGNKTWKFGIQQYPTGGSSAIAHFALKIGNTVLEHKSYALESWPTDIQWVATLTFGEVSQSQTIDYKITINEDLKN